MNIVLDIVIAGIIILCIYKGYKNGLIKTVMGLLSFIAAFIMARIFSPPLSEFMYSNWIKSGFVSGIASRIEDILGHLSLEHVVADPGRPDSFTDLLGSYGFSLPDVNRWMSEAALRGTDNITEYVAENLAAPVARGVSDFIAFAVVFALSLVLLKIVTALINRVAGLPVLNFFNKTGGAVLGSAYGAVLSFIFVILVYYALPYLAANTPIGSAHEVTDGTILFKWFFNAAPMDFN
jgi:uncharacterized membrane protein required for colicin V production